MYQVDSRVHRSKTRACLIGAPTTKARAATYAKRAWLVLD